jgi:secretion/DNA translocation related TadE-like protein
MAGTAAAVGVIACAAALSLGLASVSGASAVSQRAAGAADAAALAAADAASGAVTGIPCARASDAAARNGAGMLDCTVDGLVATVRVAVPFGRLSAVASARAGPPAEPPGAPRRGSQGRSAGE